MEELLTEEERQAANEVVDAIRKYEAGDTSYEEEMLEVISGICNFIKYSKIIKRRYRWIITFYKTISKILKSTEFSILEDYKSIDEYYSFYCSSIDTLKKYIEIGFKTDEYPDLEAAYLLTIYLSNLELNMNDYLNEISSIENSRMGGFSFCGGNLKEKCEKRTEAVRKLVAAITPKQETNEQI